ncbi:Invasion gene expression up-regulator, SirB [Burkholderiales bacterium]|nr:Invasion gene expression up-regulator, SirB [Burkholderiales bacterium]
MVSPSALLKQIHVGAVVLSLAGFFARGLGSFAHGAWISSRAARRYRDSVDTVLLVSAIALAYVLGVSPLAHPWLAAKIVGLLAYIVLGVVALRADLPLPARLAAWLAALGVFGYIVSVALTKDPLGFLR